MVKIGANDNSINLLSINIDGDSLENSPLVMAANGLFNKVFSKAIEYQIVRKAELKKLADDANQYFNTIPDDQKDDSKLGLTLKVFEDSQYQLSNEVLRDMFARLIAKTMDKRFNSDIPPAFSDILKNLSPDEAYMCKILYSTEHNTLSLFDLKFSNKSDSLGSNIFEIYNKTMEIPASENYLFWTNNTLSISKLTISLLERAGLITDVIYTDEKNSPGVEIRKTIIDSPEYQEICAFYERELETSAIFDHFELSDRHIRLSPLGVELMKICLDDESFDF